MADDDNSLTLGEETPGQVGEQTEPSGDDGNGAADRGQGTGGDGETPSKKTNPPPDNSISDDEEPDPLLEALASGTMDDIGDDGEPKKPAAGTPAEAVKEETPTEKVDDPDAEKADDPPQEKPKDEPVALSDEDKSEIDKAPKSYRKELTKLFEERHKLRDEIEQHKGKVEELAPVVQFNQAMIKHAAAAGLVFKREDGTIDAQALRDTIEERLLLAKSTPQQRAKYYREMADAEDPDSVPVSMPDDLKELVDIGSLKQEEALALARKRDAQAKQPELEKRRQSEEAARQEQQKRASGQKALQEAQEAGFTEIAKIAKGYHTRFGAEWDPIGKIVQAKLKPLLNKMDPTAWGEFAKTVIEAEVAKIRKPLKKPTTTPTPGGKPSKTGSDVSSEEDDIEALASGKPLS